MSIVIRYKGRIFKIEKGPFEPSERAADRAWYVVKQLDAGGVVHEVVSDSHKWCNDKYLGMQYAIRYAPTPK
jgi:hypothetical protein